MSSTEVGSKAKNCQLISFKDAELVEKRIQLTPTDFNSIMKALNILPTVADPNSRINKNLLTPVPNPISIHLPDIKKNYVKY